MPVEDPFVPGRTATSQTTGYAVTVATTAADTTDNVYVTIDSDPPPRSRVRVQWRTRVDVDLSIIGPARGDKGVVIFVDGEDPWLLW